MRSATALVFVVVLAAGCLGTAPAPDSTATDAGASSVSGDAVHVTVVEVVDGDTVDVAYPNGTRDTVRLLGVDTPETHGENTPGEFEGVPETADGRECLARAGERASAYARDRLAGETVALRFDERADRRGYYGRLLAYVVVDGESFNHALLREGHARVYDSTFTERERYEATEADARAAHRGLWACADPDALATTTAPATATATPLADGGSGPLEVVEVHADAAGNDHENLDDEYVTFRNAGEAALDLSGWTVADAAGHTYTVPDGTVLDPGAELTLRTGSGTDTETTLYWGADGAVWNNGGDEVVVRDDDGSVVLRYAY
ncbi:lamin tail domain-containing protein [Halobellus rubicundus]|uniref:Lamin tail domain-containing protein n=1 Tax=Halobellus rubicundus TaxID=2996466 RepID=A0ABD5MC85_9EURY